MAEESVLIFYANGRYVNVCDMMYVICSLLILLILLLMDKKIFF